MKNYINFRVIENAKTKSNAVKKLECGDISEARTLSDEVIEITPELENLLSGYTKKDRPAEAPHLAKLHSKQKLKCYSLSK